MRSPKAAGFHALDEDADELNYMRIFRIALGIRRHQADLRIRWFWEVCAQSGRVGGLVTVSRPAFRDPGTAVSKSI